MKKAFISIKTVVMLAALVGLPVMSFAQEGTPDNENASQSVTLSVDGSAMIALYSSTTGTKSPGVSLTLSGLTEAGAEIKLNTFNDDTRLRVSSLPSAGPTGTRKISASIDPPLTTSGTQLFVTLTKPGDFLPQTEGVDNGGTSTLIQELTDGDEVDLVEGIGLCWSGTENDNGYIVRYDYQQRDGALALSNAVTTVTYTISVE